MNLWLYHISYFSKKGTFVLKKNEKNISWEKYVQARAFWRNGSYAPDIYIIELIHTEIDKS